MPALSFNGMMPSVRPMLPWIALALSLSLNLFFVAGLHPSTLSGVEAAAPAPDRDKLLAEQMKLDDSQREAYQFYRQQLRDLTGAARIENQNDSDAYWDELASASPNLDTLRTLLVRLNQHRTDMQIKQTAATIDFLSLLDPAQRAILIDATHRQQDKASLRPRGRKPEDIPKPANEGPKP